MINLEIDTLVNVVNVWLLELKPTDKKNKDKWRKNTADHAVKYNQLILEWKSQGRKKCGETRTHVIDAHHINPKEKDFMVGTVMRGIKITKEELKNVFHYAQIVIEIFTILKKKMG